MVWMGYISNFGFFIIWPGDIKVQRKVSEAINEVIKGIPLNKSVLDFEIHKIGFVKNRVLIGIAVTDNIQDTIC